MSEHKDAPSDKDAELEREIRAERKFSLSEAIGRMAGPGMMKGVSPVTRKRQAEIEVQEHIARHLTDAGGVLGTVVLRLFTESEVLLNNLDQPLAALATGIRKVLDSDYLLKELVREADVEWGRVFGERPHFEVEGRPPDPDDPYTHASVRAALTALLETLAVGET
ncbi:hypothetical protein VT84_28575 [Gemmata sp. SH-PL17]|uniref:hypothetical protein n=1 Tax=Gemmata sp. SH-PL17 TaxID=1630693 RepID=UPI00078CF5A6|nr:hypothetical protein [Gemmata sp. SH-PL17]AMV28393.1 hypothetical protein VT84_28575 [Gemmata sp. SH-PL17]